MNGEIRVLRVLDEPLIGIGVAPEDDLQAVPLERVTDGAVNGVNGGPRSSDS